MERKIGELNVGLSDKKLEIELSKKAFDKKDRLQKYIFFIVLLLLV